jgi:hypothetical protein
MLDARRLAVLIRKTPTGVFEDRTIDLRSAEERGGRIVVVFAGSTREYPYSTERAQILRRPTTTTLARSERIEVDGVVWNGATEIRTFTGGGQAWAHVFYETQQGETCRVYPVSRIRVVADAAADPSAADVLSYWRAVLSRLPADDPLRPPYERLTFVHPESVLARYLAGEPIESRDHGDAPIFPFRCNLSQRSAVENALTRSVSVIEGPPGTGKTETILNVIANIVVRGGSVGVVSFNNAAVDNVRDKLDALGFGHMVAGLGRNEKRQAFFAQQESRNARVAGFLAEEPPRPSPERLAELDRRLRDLQGGELRRAERRSILNAHILERRHFEQHLERHQVPELQGLPLLGRSSDRILDYLAETATDADECRAGLITRIRRYFRFGSMRGLDPGDTEVVLGLEQAYYERRIAELQAEVEQIERRLRLADFDQLAEEHRELSAEALRAALVERYNAGVRRTFSADRYRRGGDFHDFLREYPVLLSTCHSLRDSMASGFMLDHLIIDEASQVDLPAAALAMASCRNVVVVGDLRQLPHIANQAADGLAAPAPAYDYRRHNVLSSLVALYRDHLPRTLLREHYRCAPAIIGYCNKTFYDGDLVPYTIDEGDRSMIAVGTAEGNHMRRHRGGGRSNQREIDVITAEVIPAYCQGFDDRDIGIATPYRHQVNKVMDVLIREVEADTVHKFQGRQKDVVILTTVLDESRSGQTGLRFVDDPQLINVAVSRAAKRFILVTNHALLPGSRYIRDLIGYIRYHDPDNEDVVRSAVVSVFDLLYSEYSERLRPLAARLRGELTNKSEDILWTLLHEILTEDEFAHLAVTPQVLLHHLLADLSRLTPRQEAYVRRRASVDFVVYNRVTNVPVLAIEVDGFTYHENDPVQRERDALKDAILAGCELDLLRLPTTGSGEADLIRGALRSAERSSVRPP